MSAYIIVEAIITKPKEFAAYAQAVPAIVAQYGGVYRVLGGAAESLEGDWGATRLVMHEWPSMDVARAFWESREYAAVKPLRQGTGEFRVMLVAGKQSDVLE
jgi:uncharacterized protein (DUF1330 family)